jgi:hypothetical protein
MMFVKGRDSQVQLFGPGPGIYPTIPLEESFPDN